MYNRSERKIGVENCSISIFLLGTEAIEMSISIGVQQKPPKMDRKDRQILSTTDVFNLEEVQEIKNAIQEHLIYIGLDNKNNLRNINLIGIGTSSQINVDLKEIIRLALLNVNDNVILVHNHPSNVLKPSSADIEMTNIVGVFLKTFNIRLMDHVIVGNDNYLSMMKEKYINLEYENQRIYAMQNSLLKNENETLKKEIEKITTRNNEIENEYEEEMYG